MLIQNSSVEQIVTKIASLISSPQMGVMLLVGEGSSFDIDKLIILLDGKNINFFGAIFPKVLFDNESYEDGIVAMPLLFVDAPQIIRGLNGGEISIASKDVLGNEDVSYITFVDGLSAQISKYLVTLYNEIGSGCHVIGGGAGSLSFVQKPCIFTHEGFFQDVAVLVAVKNKCKFGIAHGWNALKGPFVATKTNKNIIEELNWENAFEVYRNAVKDDVGELIPIERFSEFAGSYPFGMHKDGMEKTVRDPIATTDLGGLICVGEVPENTVLHILKGEERSLIEAAQKATSDALSEENSRIKNILVIDCISRTLFLKEAYKKELNVIKKELGNQPIGINGALSIGEIASLGEGYLEFYNKTIVVGAFYE